VAAIITWPETVAPLVGDVMLTVGRVVSPAAVTVTLTGVDVVVLPAASRAVAVKL
jgi:hypothetical protein